MISLDSLPHNPGCYLFTDGQGKVIYVGKARDIKKRVANYFQKQDHGPRTRGPRLRNQRIGLHSHKHRGRSAAAGKHTYQEASAPLQHQAQRLIPLCLHRAYRRAIPPHQNLPQGLGQGLVLRSLHLRQGEDICLSAPSQDLWSTHLQASAQARMPTLPSGPLRGTVRRQYRRG